MGVDGGTKTSIYTDQCTPSRVSMAFHSKKTNDLTEIRDIVGDASQSHGTLLTLRFKGQNIIPFNHYSQEHHKRSLISYLLLNEHCGMEAVPVGQS